MTIGQVGRWDVSERQVSPVLEDVRTPGVPEQGLGKAHNQSLTDQLPT